MQAGLESKANQKKPTKKYQELYIHGKLMCDSIWKHKKIYELPAEAINRGLHHTHYKNLTPQ